jgi:hypothetical protein
VTWFLPLGRGGSLVRHRYRRELTQGACGEREIKKRHQEEQHRRIGMPGAAGKGDTTLASRSLFLREGTRGEAEVESVASGSRSSSGTGTHFFFRAVIDAGVG